MHKVSLRVYLYQQALNSYDELWLMYELAYKEVLKSY